MSFKIQSGVAIPPKKWPRKSRNYPFAEMKVGDSFKVNKNGSKHQAVAVYGCAKQWADIHNPKAQFSYRTVDGGIRIWRVK